MKTYDTSQLEMMDRSETVGMMAASKITGLASAEISRMAKIGKLTTKAVPGKAKPELVVGDLLDLVRWKNQKKHIGQIRKLRGEKPLKKATNSGVSRVVVGVFEDAITRKPDFVNIPPSAETIGDLIIIAEAAARIERDNSKALDIQVWVAWLETL